jgi:hypothetical protein
MAGGKECKKSMRYLVNEHSIVRKIWGKADTVLFIFAGAAAEFALNKAVDWLYFTGKLPADPLERLFSTVTYARKIVFSTYNDANISIDQITAIHKQVEAARGTQIPDWAYRDVLFMLIDYSIRSYELLEGQLTNAEKIEIFNVFLRQALAWGLKTCRRITRHGLQCVTNTCSRTWNTAVLPAICLNNTANTWATNGIGY